MNVGQIYGSHDSSQSSRWLGSNYPQPVGVNTTYGYGYKQYGGSRLLERSTSTGAGGYYDTATSRRHDRSSVRSSSIGNYGQNYNSSASIGDNVHNRGFGYYDYSTSILRTPYDYGVSSQSSQSVEGGLHFLYSYYNEQGYENDFEPPRHFSWY